MEIVIIILVAISIILNIVLLILVLKNKNNNSNINLLTKKDILDNNEIIKAYIDSLNTNIKDIEKSINLFKDSFNNNFNQNFDRINNQITSNNLLINNKLNDEFKSINTLLNTNNDSNIKNITNKLTEFENHMSKDLDNIKNTVKENLDSIRTDNNLKLDQIKNTVDENLKKTLEERLNNSFKTVLDQINGLNNTIGQIQNLATDVSSLKNVLANVKTKGMIGEVVLGNLISDVLTKSQYDENVITKKGSHDRVEYAIKLPNSNDNNIVYLPVDSKFPTSSYSSVLDAINKGDKELLDKARKELIQRVREEAKDISDKYIDEPNTTSFGILFVPIEGLYSEIINLNIFEEIQNKYKVVIAGPSTFAALLNSLQMGFKTVAIEKKSSEVFNILSSVKTEFNKFADQLAKTQEKYDNASSELEKLVGVRTRTMLKSLNKVEEIPDLNTSKVLGIEEDK